MSTDHQPRPSIYTQNININTLDVHRHQHLLNYLKRYYRRFRGYHAFSTETDNILNSISSLCFVPTFILSYTLCRISEFHQLSLENITKRRPFIISSSKSKHTREIPPLEMFDQRKLFQIHPNTKLLVISYDHLKNGIKAARNHCKIKLPDCSLDCTHIFRHLEATHLYDLNIPIDEISYLLGHVSNETTYKYIHSTKKRISTSKKKGK